MILERVQLESWGCLRWPVELALHPRVNLIHAPNESGKTTLVSAIRHALLEPATANVEAYRPWESEVAPRAVVEFRTAGERWRVEKVFARRAQARLLRETRGVWEPVADDPDAVHARTVELVTGAEVARRRPGRRSTKDEAARQGVLYVLWREQGRSPLEGLDLPGTAERDLAAAVGIAVVSDRDRRIIEAAVQRADELLTKKEKKETGPLAGAAGRLEHARRTLGECEARIRALRGWEDKAESAVVILAETEGLLEDAEGERKRAEAAISAAQEFARQVAEAERDLQNARNAWSAWKKRLDDLGGARAALQQAEGERERKAAALQSRQESVDGIRSQMEGADGRQKAIEESARQAAVAASIARARFDVARDLAEGDGIAARLRQAEPLESEMREKLRERRGISVPDDDGLENLRNLKHALAVEATKLASARVRVAFSAERPLRGDVDLDGEVIPVDLPAGARFEWEALERADIHLEGVGVFRVERALETSLARQRKQVEELRTQLGDGLAAWGAPAVEELEQRAVRARACDQAIERARATLRGLLPEGRDAAERASAQVEARIQAIRQDHPELSEEMPQVEQAEAMARDAAHAAGERDKLLEQHRLDLASLRARLREAETGLPAFQEDLRRIENDANTLMGRIQTLGDDGLTDETRQARLGELESAQHEAELAVGRLTRQAPSVEDAQSALDARRREVQSLEEDRKRLAEEITTARARAAAIAEEGSYTELVRAEEALQAASAEYETLRLRADGRNLLARMLTGERDRQRAELFRPVGERVGRLWGRVSEGRYSAVQMADHLRPVSVLPRDYPREIPTPDVLSGGAQEQLGTIIRLALAEVLVAAEPEDGQAVVLDEPLPHSDPQRRRRMIELLSDPAPGLQVIVLANDRRDYASLRCDGEIDLAGVIEQAREVAAAREV